MRLHRKGKILRNFLLCLLTGLGIWALLQFPPYTVGGMCRRIQREYLLDAPVEPIWVLREPHRYSGDVMNRMYTYIIARSGEDYLSFQYDQYLLQNQRRTSRAPELGKGRLCVTRNGTIYVAGPLEEVAAVTATVITTGKTFVLDGKRLEPELFAIPFAEADRRYFPRQDVPLEEMGLADAIDRWYWDDNGGGGRTLRHEDIPCIVTLYDEAGMAMDTWELEVETYDVYGIL